MRKIMAVVTVGLLGLFGFYYMKNTGDGDKMERAKDALRQVGDKVRDSSVAGLVKAKLASNFGLDGSRFLHCFYDQGNVVVYGLVPDTLTAEQIAGIAGKVTGVDSVEVIVSPRPGFIGAEDDGTVPPPETPAGD